MATSAMLQSLVAKSVPRGWYNLPRQQRVGSITFVRCQSELKKRAGKKVLQLKVAPKSYEHNMALVSADAKEEEPAAAAAPQPLKAPSSPIQTPLPTTNKVSTKFSDVLAFSGPAPERINGRLAMIGFVSALAVELATGVDLAAQLTNGGAPWFLGTTVLLSVASLIPLFKGVSVQAMSDGLMTSDAELWNGRFAMLGLVALFFTEYVKGGALM